MEMLAVGLALGLGFFLALTLQWALLGAIVRQMARVQRVPISERPAGAS